MRWLAYNVMIVLIVMMIIVTINIIQGCGESQGRELSGVKKLRSTLSAFHLWGFSECTALPSMVLGRRVTNIHVAPAHALLAAGRYDKRSLSATLNC